MTYEGRWSAKKAGVGEEREGKRRGGRQREVERVMEREGKRDSEG